MGIGAPRKPSARKPDASEEEKNGDPAFPVIAPIALVLLLALFIPAMRVLGTDPRYDGFGWTTAIVVGAIMAIVGALFAYAFLGGRTWFDVRYYFWKRMLLLAVVTAIFSPIVYFLMQWLLFPCIAIALFLALGAAFALILLSGDL